NLTANASENHIFTEWTGNISTIDDVNSSDTTIEILDNYNITAEFEEDTDEEPEPTPTAAPGQNTTTIITLFIIALGIYWYKKE
ncbi:MAG: hypothetical protein ACOCTT_01970, partial [archaeon]